MQLIALALLAIIAIAVFRMSDLNQFGRFKSTMDVSMRDQSVCDCVSLSAFCGALV